MLVSKIENIEGGKTTTTRFEHCQISRKQNSRCDCSETASELSSEMLLNLLQVNDHVICLLIQ